MKHWNERAAEELFAVCDALEVVNGRGKPEENLFSQSLCDRLGLAGTGGSDIHREEHIGKACTKFHNEYLAGRLGPGVDPGACVAETGYA